MTEYKRVGDLPMFEQLEVMRSLQRGTPLQTFRSDWEDGTLDSIGRFMGSDVAYVNHKDRLLVMYFFGEIRVPIEVYEFVKGSA